MKIKIKKDWCKHLCVIKNIINKKPVNGILGHIIIEPIAYNLIKVSATNLEMYYITEIHCEIEDFVENKSFSVKYDILKNYLKSDICIEYNDNEKVKINNIKFDFNVFSKYDFPESNNKIDGEYKKLNPDFFVGIKEASDYTFKPDNDIAEFRKSVCYKDNKIIATDGFRLYHRELKNNGIDKYEVVEDEFLIPVELCKTISEFKKMTEYGRTDKVVILRNDYSSLCFRIYESKFIKYRQVLDHDTDFNSVKISIDNAIINKLKEIKILVDATGRVEFVIEKNKLYFQVGENKIYVKDIEDAEDITVPFNHSYLVNILSTIKDYCVFEYKTNKVQSYFKNNNLIIVLMPMRF